MPKSKRSKVVHMTQVNKKTREHKESLFENIRKCIPQYQYCYVFNVDNMRNTYLKEARQELSDSRYVVPHLAISLPNHYNIKVYNEVLM